MKKTFKFKLIVAALFVVTSIFASVYSKQLHTTQMALALYPATSGYNAVTGWMWMDGVGWISLSSSNDHDPTVSGVQPATTAYGVEQKASSPFDWKGEAWSPAVGWINFTPTSCPTGTKVDSTHPCGVQMVANGSVNELRGFAEFASSAAWWDKYISFSSANDHDPTDGTGGAIQPSSNTYGASVDGFGNILNLAGGTTPPAYAWHSDGGWMAFVGAKVAGIGPTAGVHLIPTLTSVTSITGTESTTLSTSSSSIKLWYYKDVGAPAYTSCTATSVASSSTWNGISAVPSTTGGVASATSGTYTHTTTAPQTYKLSCSYVGMTAPDEAIATVTDPTYSPGCTVDLQLTPLFQDPPNCVGQVPELVWVTTGTSSCTGSWQAFGASALPGNDNTSSSPLPALGSGTTTYTMSCTPAVGAPCTSVPITITCTGGGLPQCDDGVDNSDAEDTLVDSLDPGCHTDGTLDPFTYDASDNNEVDFPYACSDGKDNDSDGKTDYPADPGCTGPTGKSEKGGSIIDQ